MRRLGYIGGKRIKDLPTESIKDGAVTTDKIADGAVTAEKIADPIAITQEYEVEVITAQDSVTVLADGGG